ncbi:hypothetical protein PEBR_36295 [Penicillium brasilianum]|uniref:Uncharacterized protein n=1 Tax=Penicillium brasilianum TaxID=104259 RepID=A0A1S9RD59_PENBI|nr:hypothetical protein PEBR_36295 [Penicillium brasilianum]
MGLPTHASENARHITETLPYMHIFRRMQVQRSSIINVDNVDSQTQKSLRNLRWPSCKVSLALFGEAATGQILNTFASADTKAPKQDGKA